MGEFGDAFHVVHVAAFENDMRESDERSILVDGGFECGEVGCDVVVAGADADDLMAIAERLIDALQNVKVGGKVESIGDDAGLVGLQCECRGGELEEVDRDGIANESLSRRRADELTDLIPHPRGSVPPAFVPAADEVFAPLLIHNLARFFLCGFGHHAKRVTIEVDQAWVGNDKRLFERGEFILFIELKGEITFGGEVHQVTYGSGFRPIVTGFGKLDD